MSPIVSGGGSGGSQTVLMDSTTLTSGQLLSLHTTPVELIAAPGGRFYFVPVFAVAHYRFATTPYVTSGTVKLQAGFGTTKTQIQNGNGEFGAVFYWAATGSLLPTGPELLLQTADAYSHDAYDSNYGPGTTVYLATAIENKAFSIVNAGDAVTGGDGTLTLRVFYGLIDGAP